MAPGLTRAGHAALRHPHNAPIASARPRPCASTAASIAPGAHAPAAHPPPPTHRRHHFPGAPPRRRRSCPEGARARPPGPAARTARYAVPSLHVRTAAGARPLHWARASLIGRPDGGTAPIRADWRRPSPGVPARRRAARGGIRPPLSPPPTLRPNSPHRGAHGRMRGRPLHQWHLHACVCVHVCVCAPAQPHPTLLSPRQHSLRAALAPESGTTPMRALPRARVPRRRCNTAVPLLTSAPVTLRVTGARLHRAASASAPPSKWALECCRSGAVARPGSCSQAATRRTVRVSRQTPPRTRLPPQPPPAAPRRSGSSRRAARRPPPASPAARPRA